MLSLCVGSTNKSKFWRILMTGLAFAALFVYYNEGFLIYTTGYQSAGKWVGEHGVAVSCGKLP